MQNYRPAAQWRPALDEMDQTAEPGLRNPPFRVALHSFLFQ